MSVSGLGLGGYHDCAKAKLGPRIWSWSGRLWSIQRRVSSCHLLRADWWCWADDSGVAVVIIIIYQCCYVTAIQFKSNHSFFLFLVSVGPKTHLPVYPLHHTPLPPPQQDQHTATRHPTIPEQQNTTSILVMSTKSRGFCPFSIVLFAGTAYSYVKHLQSKSSKQKSEQIVTMTSRCRPVVICGPSGVGKGTLIELLQKQFPADKFGVSMCTR